MIENLSRVIAENISKELNYDNDKKEVIQYGTYALIQTLISIISVLVLGLILGVSLEALVFLFTASILRKYSGGAHSESSNTCTIIGIVTSLLVGVLVKSGFVINIQFEYIVYLSIIIFVFTYFIIIKYAPVDTPNKVIKTEKKKKRMKKESLRILTIYLILVVLGIISYYKFNLIGLKPVILSILLGSSWQCMTLTRFGKVLLKTIDSFVK